MLSCDWNITKLQKGVKRLRDFAVWGEDINASFAVNKLFVDERPEDKDVLEHSQNTAELAVAFAAYLLRSYAFLCQIFLAGLNHDLAKYMIPIHRFKRSLSDKEWKEMQGHAEMSFEMALVGLIVRDSEVRDAIEDVHRWDDGIGGYPQIERPKTEMGKILSFADAFDAMVSNRPYRRAMSWQEALRELDQDANQGKYDKESLKIFRQFIFKKYA